MLGAYSFGGHTIQDGTHFENVHSPSPARLYRVADNKEEAVSLLRKSLLIFIV